VKGTAYKDHFNQVVPQEML